MAQRKRYMLFGHYHRYPGMADQDCLGMFDTDQEMQALMQGEGSEREVYLSLDLDTGQWQQVSPNTQS